MNFCLSDLVPPLRWSDATGFSQLRDVSGLPDAWWRSVPISRVFAVLDPEALGELLTELALDHWPAASVGDILPALHVMDPDEADDPQVSIALDRVGSWFGLLALTGRELADQPFVKARPVLAALFTAVFVRLTPTGEQGAHSDEQAAGGSFTANKTNGLSPAQAPERPAPVETKPALPPLPKRRPGGVDPQNDPLGLAAARMAEAALQQRLSRPDGDSGSRTSMFTPPPRPDRSGSASGDSPFASDSPLGRGVLPFGDPTPLPRRPSASPPEPPPLPKRSAASPLDPAPLPKRPSASPLDPAPLPKRPAASPPEPPPFTRLPFSPDPKSASALGSEPPPFAKDPSFGGGAAAPRPFVPEPEPFDAADPLGRGAREAAAPVAADAPEVQAPEAPETAPEGGQDVLDEPQAQAQEGHDGAGASEADDGPENPPTPVGVTTDDFDVPTEGDIPSLIDAAFSDLDDKTWAVAQNHVFTDAPAAPEELAKLFAVSPEEIIALEEELRARLAAWLESPDAGPYTQHLEKLPGTLGVAAPKGRLIAAADWHSRELRSLDVPAWQFVLATLPEYTVQDDWLIDGDIADLRDQTCRLILNADRPPTVARALELVSTLGIHPEVAKEWLENVPQLRIQSKKPAKAADADAADRPGDPVGPLSGPTGQLKDVSMTRRCFRHPDGLWWLRIDVSPEQLNGAECPLPSGFASYLGMSPGESRTVMSAAGETTLNWQARPVLESIGQLLHDMGAQPGSHLFLTVADEDQVLRARLVPASTGDADRNTLALRLAGYTSAGEPESVDETIRVLATRVGMTGPVGLPELMNRLRERGDRDLLSLLV